MKKIIILRIVISLIIVLGLSILIVSSNDQLKFKLSYESINYYEYDNGKRIKVDIPYKNRIKYLDEKNIMKYLKEETGVFYFGYNTCPWCRNIVSILIDVVKENNVDKIYYIDTHNISLSNVKKELFEFLGDNLEENYEGNKVLAVPDVYFIKDGVIIGHHLGSVEGYINPYQGMSDIQKQELANIYQSFIKELK